MYKIEIRLVIVQRVCIHINAAQSTYPPLQEPCQNLGIIFASARTVPHFPLQESCQ